MKDRLIHLVGNTLVECNSVLDLCADGRLDGRPRLVPRLSWEAAAPSPGDRVRTPQGREGFVLHVTPGLYEGKPYTVGFCDDTQDDPIGFFEANDLTLVATATYKMVPN